MQQSYLKNAALLTGSDVVLRLAGMGLRIWLANELGGEGMGLYQLVLAVYSLFVTLATAGVRWRLPGSWPRNSAARLLPVVQPAACCAVCWRQGLCWGCLPPRCSWQQRILRPGGGWGICVPPELCVFQRWGCHGWRFLRCCAAFSSPGGM